MLFQSILWHASRGSGNFRSAILAGPSIRRLLAFVMATITWQSSTAQTASRPLRGAVAVQVVEATIRATDGASAWTRATSAQVVIGAESGSDVLKSAERYSTVLAGIYSTKPGTVGRRQTTDARTSATEVPMAMAGIVPTKVSAENGPIKWGDLLVTSSTLEYAMKGTDGNRMLGAVVGKALGALDSGTGVIEVRITLQ
jgi:hypothetical protein